MFMASEAEVKASLDACECFEEFTVTDKEEIDTAAQLMEVREWRGAIAIFGFAESIGELEEYAKEKGVRVSEVVCLDDVEVTDKEVIDGLASLMEGREWKGKIKIDESNSELRKYAKEKGIPVIEVVSSPSK
ncbi:hypothetical protein Acr_23g0004090 [Actinidia rufa]|uniref:Uncharacterized protein n=1 Tax=Actinidia rufa TaxID=165716 RepID=A0A7J0GMW8_9ERIC|nr:hypothetical protein Acr_23g0004090 [Actinidia rufa]